MDKILHINGKFLCIFVNYVFTSVILQKWMGT
jgi:hypothetical protein